MLIYALVPLLLSFGVGFHFVVVSEAPPRAKVVVATLLIVSLLVLWRFPRLMLLAILLQVGTALYAVLYLKLHPHGF